mgnify:CR=1 FL=1
MRNITETVKHLLIINGIFFLATLTLGNQVYDWFALHYPTNPKFEYWQPLTHMFMHGDFSHIFFNMFGLYMFGTPLEQMWGKQKFIFFYISTGLGAASLQLLLYYYQIGMVNSSLMEFGLSGYDIGQFYETAQLPTQAIDRVGEQSPPAAGTRPSGCGTSAIAPACTSRGTTTRTSTQSRRTRAGPSSSR